jgi:hypothetical protein
MKPEMTLVRQLAKWTAISAIPGVLLVLFATLYSRRRRRRSRSATDASSTADAVPTASRRAASAHGEAAGNRRARQAYERS